MVNFLIYPAIDSEYNFPVEVRQAIADSPEVSAAVERIIANDIFDGGAP